MTAMSYGFLLLSSLVFAYGCGSDDAQGARLEGNAPQGTTEVEPSETGTVTLGPTSMLKSDVGRASADDSQIADVVDGLNEFSWDLYSSTRGLENHVVSPLSLSMAWAMLSTAAGGQTLAEVNSSLRFDRAGEGLHEGYNALLQDLDARNREGTDKRDPQSLLVSGDVWVGLNAAPETSVLDSMARYYGAGVHLADFAAQPELVRQAINAKIELDTNGLIPELLPQSAVKPGLLAIVTSTVYFRALWSVQFEDEAQIDFAPPQGGSVAVDGMTGLVFPDYARGENFEAFALPYKAQELEMVFVVPDQGAFEAVAEDASASWATSLRQELQLANVRLTLPKFEVEAASDLASTLADMGMPKAFESDADFDTLDPNLFVNSVIHGAKVTVDDRGTEAAAATAILNLPAGGLPPEQLALTIDRPFIFWIRDRATGAILFVGQVLNPSA